MSALVSQLKPSMRPGPIDTASGNEPGGRCWLRSLHDLGCDSRGVTGLETAIVLIAFVVVASVFAFAVLSSGLLSTEKSKETVLGGLREAQATLVLKGSVIGVADSFFLTEIQTIRYQVAV
jgi:flagellin-like protein